MSSTNHPDSLTEDKTSGWPFSQRPLRRLELAAVFDITAQKLGLAGESCSPQTQIGVTKRLLAFQASTAAKTNITMLGVVAAFASPNPTPL